MSDPKKIYIIPPVRVPTRLDASGKFPTVKPIEVVLTDGEDVLGKVLKVCKDAAMENVEVSGVMLGAVHYFTLQEEMRAYFREVGRDAERDAGCTVNGVAIHMDPSRDEGDVVPIYTKQGALDMYARRRLANPRSKP